MPERASSKTSREVTELSRTHPRIVAEGNPERMPRTTASQVSPFASRASMITTDGDMAAHAPRRAAAESKSWKCVPPRRAEPRSAKSRARSCWPTTTAYTGALMLDGVSLHESLREAEKRTRLAESAPTARVLSDRDTRPCSAPHDFMLVTISRL